MTQAISVIGTSVRALAQSVVRAGMRPICADCYADQDLSNRCGVVRIRDYPRELAKFMSRSPNIPWMYTGGLENYPQLIDQISKDRRLFGNSGNILRAVRDPFVVSLALRDAGLDTPEIRPAGAQVESNGSWFCKSKSSSGGLKVRLYYGQPPYDHDTYFQRRITGRSCSAIYLATTRQTELLGVTEQIVNRPWTGAPKFAYSGSIGPIRLDRYAQEQVKRTGEVLRSRFGLQGLFGVDAILTNKRWWTIEINPRYTASVEILERAQNLCAAGLHVAACSGKEILPLQSQPKWLMHGKLIIYATQPVVATPEFCSWIAEQNNQEQHWASTADLPHPHTAFSSGEPIMTIFASGNHLQSVEIRLKHFLMEIRRRLVPLQQIRCPTMIH